MAEIIYYLLIAPVFAHIAWTDYKYRYIYDLDIAAAAALSLGYAAYAGSLKATAAGGATGLAAGLILYFACALIYGAGKGFGEGDVLLLAALGLFFGESFPAFFAFAVTASALMLTPLFFIKGRRAAKLRLPLAALLACAMSAYIFLGRPGLDALLTFIRH